jgi:hypothetical protein
MGLPMEGTLIMPVLLIVIVAVIILIAIMRGASKSTRQCPYCKNYINGKATVCEYCHRDVTGISS